MTPMMLQYLEIKKQYSDFLLFYRLGDFYEMFFDDAKIASKELDLVLTGRDCGEPERAPMCGIPYHACDSYIARLIDKGYKIAICEQLEDPALAKGLVKRDIVRIITPGTITDNKLLDEGSNNYLSSLYINDLTAAISFCDISTGKISSASFSAENFHDLEIRIINEIALFKPSEIILNKQREEIPEIASYTVNTYKCLLYTPDTGFFNLSEARLLISTQIPGFDRNRASDELIISVGAILAYLNETQKTTVSTIKTIDLYDNDNYLSIDAFSRKNLELCETMRTREKKGSLLGVLDKTKTGSGTRMLRRFIEQPLMNCRSIKRRQDAVGEFLDNQALRDQVRDTLTGAADMERLLTKIMYGTASARDLVAIKTSLAVLFTLYNQIINTSSEEITSLRDDIYAAKDKLLELCDLIESAIVDEPPFSVREGGMIRKGYNERVDELNMLINESNTYISNVEATEKEATGIKTMKIGYNRVFGYYIEVAKGSVNLVPDRYIRKQTLTNCERYITEELKDIESRILSARDQITSVEFELFTNVCDAVKNCYNEICDMANIIAKIDVYASLAEVAYKNNYVCPEVDYSDIIDIKDGRHPIVEEFTDGMFIPNDCRLDDTTCRVAIITGPNMAGKSTYMRQVALCVVMAQMGSYVPASSARIGVIDKIFTRIGASDDLASGQSTFMLEMSEVAYILSHATNKSLIIYDEIGRGTSTYDGMSIARSVLEYTASKKINAKTLFATHYHELKELEETVELVKNYNIAAKKRGDSVIFLRKIVPGSADDSYGIEVAALAGVPGEVVKRSKEILKSLEAKEPVPVKRARNSQEFVPMSFEEIAKDEILNKLKGLVPDTISPIEALTILNDLSKEAKKL